MKKTPGDTIILHIIIFVPKITIRWCTVPEKWCGTDGQTDGKSDTESWVPHLKTAETSLKWAPFAASNSVNRLNKKKINFYGRNTRKKYPINKTSVSIKSYCKKLNLYPSLFFFLPVCGPLREATTLDILSIFLIFFWRTLSRLLFFAWCSWGVTK